MKVEIKRKDQEIEAEEVFKKQIKKFSKSSAHIIVPKRFLGYNATVVIEEATGNAISKWGKEMKKRNQIK